MKSSVKKPRNKPVKKAAGTKKKKRQKLKPVDRIRAIIIAGVLIVAAGISTLAVYHLHSAKARNEAAARAEETVAPSGESPAEKTTAPETGGPVSLPLPVTPQAPETKIDPVAAAPVKPTEQKSAPVVEKTPQQKPASPRTEPPARSSPAAPAAERKAPPAASPSAGTVTERPSVPSAGALAFVIDDAGNNLRDLEPFLKFPGPLTIAVLPGLPHSAEAARLIRAAGKEVFLHQPMEALGGTNPGPGAIKAGMGSEEIRAIISRNLDEIGPVAGINNHEGSRITMDEKAMETILALCREKGILFLDSRTTAETAGPRTARMLGMTIGERDIFIDNIQEKTSMLNYINSGLTRAGQKGSAIMIGHVWSPALAPLLEEIYPDLNARGFTVSRVSKLINGKKQ